MQADTCIGDMDMKIVIIGGTGLIGRPLVGLLLAAAVTDDTYRPDESFFGRIRSAFS